VARSTCPGQPCGGERSVSRSVFWAPRGQGQGGDVVERRQGQRARVAGNPRRRPLSGGGASHHRDGRIRPDQHARRSPYAAAPTSRGPRAAARRGCDLTACLERRVRNEHGRGSRGAPDADLGARHGRLRRLVSPCGENGEFHTFVYAGPGLRQPVCHQRGAVVVRDGRFVYCDLVETASR